jgi:cytochrome b
MNDSGRRMIVWDGPTRLFHWVAVLLVVAAYVTWRLNWMDWHAKAGYALLTAVLFRILWGFFGSESARFSSFLASPRAVARHLVHAFRRDPDRQVGHNPAGGWMVLLLLVLLLGEPLTGAYVASDVADEGAWTELTPASVANAITALHGIFWNILLAAVALHLLAILLYTAVRRHHLVGPMITGWKSLPPDVPQPRLAAPARAAVLFGCSALAVAAFAHVL